LLDRGVSWTSSTPGIASVNQLGVITAVNAGTATISASSEGRTANVNVQVALVPVASVQVTPATKSMFVTQTQQLTATPKDSIGGTLLNRTVTFSTSDATVATVTTTGLVTGTGGGTATITATSEGKSATSV